MCLPIVPIVLLKCKFQILLFGSSFDQVLQRLGKLHFSYQIIDCLYTLYKHRIYSKKSFINWPSFTPTKLGCCSSQFGMKKSRKTSKYCKKNVCCAKFLNVLNFVLTRNWLPHKLLVQHFRKKFVQYKTQNMNLNCFKKLIF